jgi:hypothetical protein
MSNNNQNSTQITLDHFLSNVTDYINSVQLGLAFTANQIVFHAMDEADMHDYCLESYSNLVSSIIKLNFLELEPVGKTFDGEILYQHSSI